MTRNGLIRIIATCGAAVAVGLAGSATAFAATSPAASPSAVAAQQLTLQQLKARCNVAVQRRLGTLGADEAFVARTPALTSADRATLLGQISADRGGLTELDQTIQRDTTWQQARSDCMRIVTGFRVYVLEDPKIHEVIAADGVTKVDSAFETLVPALQNLIDSSSRPPSVKERAGDLLIDLRNKVRASETSVSGVTGSVIHLQPSGYPGNAVVLRSAAQNIHTSRTDLAGARFDVAQILLLLGS